MGANGPEFEPDTLLTVNDLGGGSFEIDIDDRWSTNGQPATFRPHLRPRTMLGR
jgi:hypothetical protein